MYDSLVATRERMRRLRRQRTRVARLFQRTCPCGNHLQNARLQYNSYGWQLVPVTKEAYAITKKHTKLKHIDGLTDDFLKDNFEVLCETCYIAWCEEEVGLCDKRLIAQRPARSRLEP